MSKKILVEVSARHVHLSEKDAKILFGEGYQLTVKKNLSQKGQFACNERVEVVGEKGSFKSVGIIGPERKNSQVEISKTDAIKIGISAPIAESGNLDGSGSCKIIGPNGEVVLKEGVIIAKRHIHATNSDAKELGVEDGEIVSVKIDSKDRSLIFKDVVVRVSDNFTLAMHIDTDEANAANVFLGSEAEIVKL